MLSEIWNGFLDILFPRKCTLCAKLLGKDERDFCWDCRFNLPLFQGKITSGLYLGDVFSVFTYGKAVRDSLLRFKFNGMAHYAKSYAPLIAAAVQGKSTCTYDAVTWIPVSRQRRRKRGYDQAYLLAKAVSKELNLPVVPTLRKVRNNGVQSRQSSTEMRKANVLGAYQAKNAEKWVGFKLLLLDDIWTTGATAGEAARTLLTGGAGLVDCAVVAAVEER